MPKLSVTIDFPSLPEGWKGSPDKFLTWIKENAQFEIDGDFLTGQIGGSEPTENIGIWIDGTTFKVWDESKSKYVTGSDIPVGIVAPWASALSTPPDNWLFCDGTTKLRADYPELFASIGVSYTPDNVTLDATEFYLPHLESRYPIGAGQGNAELTPGVGAGKLPEYLVGQYVGRASPKNDQPPVEGPTSALRFVGLQPKTSTKAGFIIPPSVAMQYIIRAK